MIELSKRMSLIAKIAEQKPLLGKTAMMKFIFILQQVYKVPAGYDYEIYTYGPYSSLEEISRSVKKIKPHFDIDLIKDEYRKLDELGILERSV